MVDFSLLQTPDFAGALQGGIKQGRANAQQSRIQGALAAYNDNPEAAEGALISAGDIQSAQSLGAIRRAKVADEQAEAKLKVQQDALAAQKAAGSLFATDPKAAVNAATASGDVDLAEHLSKLDESQRGSALQHITLLSNVAQQIAATSKDPAERARMAQHIATTHPDLGINPSEITPEAMTDEAINGLRMATTKAEEQYTLTPGSARYKGSEKIAEAPFAPHYETVAPGQTLIQTNGAEGAPAGIPSVPQVEAVLTEVVPGFRPTSTFRTADHNSEVGGAENSYHTRGDGQAVDFPAPKGVSIDQIKQHLASRGVHVTEALNEGDHFHIAWDAPPAAGGAKVVATGGAKPQYRTASPAEVAAAGLPVGTPAQVSPEGKVEPFSNGANLKPIPSTAARAMADTTTAMNKIDSALKAVDAYPQGLGLLNHVGDAVRQRTDPNGVDVRAAVADIGSQIIHDRSGAAVTISETPRLVPFIPNVNDTPATVKKKLTRLRANLENDLANTQIEFGPDSGYRQTGDPAPSTAPKAKAATSGWKIIP